LKRTLKRELKETETRYRKDLWICPICEMS
jgi:hypothetical protein